MLVSSRPVLPLAEEVWLSLSLDVEAALVGCDDVLLPVLLLTSVGLLPPVPALSPALLLGLLLLVSSALLWLVEPWAKLLPALLPASVPRCDSPSDCWPHFMLEPVSELLLRREVEDVNDAVFAELTYHAAYEPVRAIRTERWKYIRRFGDRLRPVLPNVDDSPTKDLLLAEGWGDLELPRETLHDLRFDPVEAHNLIDAPHAAEIADDLRARLDRASRRAPPPASLRCAGPAIARRRHPCQSRARRVDFGHPPSPSSRVGRPYGVSAPNAARCASPSAPCRGRPRACCR